MLASLMSGRPSRQLIVIGVTGTDGKTTTASFIADILRSSGARVGLSTSAVIQIGDQRRLNESHLTMPGRFQLQRLLRDMVQAGCQYAVIEASSEGMTQFRHTNIDFDVVVLTNLSPEHIEAHGSFESYKKAKGLLFSSIIRSGDKHLFGKIIPKVTVVNLDDPEHEYFLKFWAEKQYGTSLSNPGVTTYDNDKMTVITGSEEQTTKGGMNFTVGHHHFFLPLPGEYNVRNALQAIAVGRALGLDWENIIKGLASAHQIPGRAEEVTTGKPWRVVIDYALTPAALEQFYRSLQKSGVTRIIGVFGAAGGGRDAWKRPELGKIAAQYCSKIILTTDDPYFEEPQHIAGAIMAGVPDTQRSIVEIVVDRREAIKKAMSLAQAGDVIAITGMGSETSMMVKGKNVAWSDVQIAQDLLFSK